MTYATAQDVANELGRPLGSFSAEQITQIEGWLRRAESSIKVRIPDLDAQITAGTIDEQTVIDVEAAAVARKAENPSGKQNERIDDYSYGLVDDAATVDVVITDAEWLLLMPSRRRGAFTIRPGWG